MEHFLLTFPHHYQNVYDQQNFGDADMLQGAAWQIKYTSPFAEDVLTPPHQARG